MSREDFWWAMYCTGAHLRVCRAHIRRYVPRYQPILRYARHIRDDPSRHQLM